MKIENSFTVNVDYDHDDHVWIGYITEIPGCVATGDTKEEVVYKLKKRIVRMIDTKKPS